MLLLQIRKCDDANCCSAKKLPAEDLAWLPDLVPDSSGEHYKSYEVLLAQETTQEHMPSNKNFVGKVSEDAQVMMFFFKYMYMHFNLHIYMFQISTFL